MGHPRYAATGVRLDFSNFSLSRTLFGLTVLALVGLLCLPLVTRSGGNRLSAATGPQAGPATAGSSPSALPSVTSTGSLDAVDIRPSKVVTEAPAAGPVAGGLFGPTGEIGALGIPVMVLHAYHLAADELAVEQPACKLPWWLLAGIGHTESGHAEDGRLTADGTTRGLILGPRLNGGIAGDAVISDTDHGFYDGDKVYDRAVGPMQFIPSTWVRWGADGNHDGKKDPSNIFDATLAAGRYLCADGRDLSTKAGLDAAVLSYNNSQPYLATVLAWGMAYRDGASAVGDSPLPVVGDVTKVRPPISSRPPTSSPSRPPVSSPHPSRTPTPSPTGSPSCSSSASPSGSVSSSASLSGSASESAGSPSGSPSPSGSSTGPTGSPSPTGCAR